MPPARSTREVVEDHLSLRKGGRLDDDLDRNYSRDVVLLSSEGIHRGHDGVRELWSILYDWVHDGDEFEIVDLHVEGEVALELWRSHGSGRDVNSGADTFVVRDGLIVAQTIWFAMEGSDGP